MISPNPVVHFLYEPGNGGLDRVAILLANGMAQRGIPTELWLTRATGAVAHLIASDVKIRMVPTPKFGGRGVQLFLQIPMVASMIRKHRPEVIFSAGNQTNLSLAIARKMAGQLPTKIIQKITNPVLRPGFASWVKVYRTWRFGVTARLGDMTLTLSKADAEKYAKTFPREAEKFHAVPNPYVSPEMLAAAEERDVRDPGLALRLLSVGRIAPQKGCMTLISALARITDRPWSMTILGDGPLLQEAKRLVEKNDLSERIRFTGFVDDVTRYFTQSDMLVLSSRWEGFPAVAIEAMATGCALVATDCCAGLTQQLRLIGQDTVPVHDPEALAKAICEQMDSPQPIAALRALAGAYTIENSVDQHLMLMEQVCRTS